MITGIFLRYLILSAYHPQEMPLAKNYQSPDSITYMELAESLYHKGTFTRNDKADTFRTPAYPIYLSLFMGLNLASFWALCGQNIFSLLCLGLFYYLIRQYLDLKYAFYGGLLMATSPLVILYSQKILSESLFHSFLILTLYIFMKSVSAKSSLHFVCLGLTFSLLSFLRPLALFLPFFLPVVLCDQKNILKKYFMYSLTVYVVTTGMWQYRNYRETNHFIFSSVSSYNLYTYRAAGVDAMISGDNFETSRKKYQDRYGALMKTGSVTLESLKIFILHPFATMRVIGSGMFRLLLDPGASEYLKFFNLSKPEGGLLKEVINQGAIKTLIRESSENMAFLGYHILLSPYTILLLFGSLICICQPHHWKHSLNMRFVIFAFIYFLIFSSGPETTARFRLPLEIFMIVMSVFIWDKSFPESLDNI